MTTATPRTASPAAGLLRTPGPGRRASHTAAAAAAARARPRCPVRKPSHPPVLLERARTAEKLHRLLWTARRGASSKTPDLCPTTYALSGRRRAWRPTKLRPCALDQSSWRLGRGRDSQPLGVHGWTDGAGSRSPNIQRTTHAVVGALGNAGSARGDQERARHHSPGESRRGAGREMEHQLHEGGEGGRAWPALIRTGGPVTGCAGLAWMGRGRGHASGFGWPCLSCVVDAIRCAGKDVAVCDARPSQLSVDDEVCAVVRLVFVPSTYFLAACSFRAW